jgi:hypothetical protein
MCQVLDVVLGDVTISRYPSGAVLKHASVIPIGPISRSLRILSQRSLHALRMNAVNVHDRGVMSITSASKVTKNAVD